MKSSKKILASALVFSFFFFSNAFAVTCYSPNYGYYECDPGYSSYPNAEQAMIEGAFIGVILGGFLNDDYYQDRGYWHGDHRHGGEHEGGRGWGGHGGGHHH